jgi:hypothetical protein
MNKTSRNGVRNVRNVRKSSKRKNKNKRKSRRYRSYIGGAQFTFSPEYQAQQQAEQQRILGQYGQPGMTQPSAYQIAQLHGTGGGVGQSFSSGGFGSPQYGFDLTGVPGR